MSHPTKAERLAVKMDSEIYSMQHKGAIQETLIDAPTHYKCPCGGTIWKIKVGYTWRWTCQKCESDYGYGTTKPMR